MPDSVKTMVEKKSTLLMLGRTYSNLSVEYVEWSGGGDKKEEKADEIVDDDDDGVDEN